MNRFLKLSLIPLVLLLVGLAAYYAYLTFKPVPTKPGEVAKKDIEKLVKEYNTRKREVPIMKVGREELYQGDLSYFVTVNYPKAATSTATLTHAVEAWTKQATMDSIMLHEGFKENIATVSPTVFNYVGKNYYDRNTALIAIKKELEKRHINTITGEAISIWFHNQTYPEPKVGYVKAQEIAKQKIDAIYTDLLSNKITWEAAVQRVLSDTSLKDIDPNYTANGYFKFVDKPVSFNMFINPKTKEAALALQPGEMTGVLLLNDWDNKTGESYDALYKVIRVTDKKTRGYDSFDAWYEAKKPQYEIKIY